MQQAWYRLRDERLCAALSCSCTTVNGSVLLAAATSLSRASNAMSTCLHCMPTTAGLTAAEPPADLKRYAVTICVKRQHPGSQSAGRLEGLVSVDQPHHSGG